MNSAFKVMFYALHLPLPPTQCLASYRTRSYWPEAAWSVALCCGVLSPLLTAASVNMSATLKLPKRRGGGSENFRAGDHFDRQSIQGYLENGVIAGDSSSFAKRTMCNLKRLFLIRNDCLCEMNSDRLRDLFRRLDPSVHSFWLQLRTDIGADDFSKVGVVSRPKRHLFRWVDGLEGHGFAPFRQSGYRRNPNRREERQNDSALFYRHPAAIQSYDRCIHESRWAGRTPSSGHAGLDSGFVHGSGVQPVCAGRGGVCS